MGEDIVRAGTAPHSPCSCGRQSWLLFARLRGEQHGPARAPLGSSLHSQEPPPSAHPSSPGRGSSPRASHTAGSPKAQGGAAVLHRSTGETTSGPTSAQQAGKSSPGSAACKVPAQTSVSSQGKKAQTLTVQHPRTLQKHRREKLGCKQQGVCRAVTDSSRLRHTTGAF